MTFLSRSPLLLAACCLVLLPASIQAQGVMSGQVHDVAGAGLPGVMVDAIGVATYDKRIVMDGTVIADQNGHYQLDLPPGMYSVRFSLPGFGSAIHENIGVEDSCHTGVDARLRRIEVRDGLVVAGVHPYAAPSSMGDRLPPVRRDVLTSRRDPSPATLLIERVPRRHQWRHSIERQLFSRPIEDACRGYVPMWMSHLVLWWPCQVA